MKFIRPFKQTLAVLLLLVTALPVAAHGQSAPARPKVIFFDVNETLLDLESMRASVGQALNGQNELLPLWFSTMLHYSLVDTATQRYHNFGDIGVATLMVVAAHAWDIAGLKAAGMTGVFAELAAWLESL